MRLAKWRENTGTSRDQLVEMLDMVNLLRHATHTVAYQALRRYELGESGIPITLVPKLIGITGGEVSIGELAATRQEYIDAQDVAKVSETAS